MRASRVLVVDDEADIRDLIRDILSDEGYDVAVAANADEARAARRKAEPDLVLLDIWMPGTDGITLLREWRHGGALSFPVLIMSGHGTVDTAVEATRLGAFDYLEKPVSLAKLLHNVERALREGRVQKPGGTRRVPMMSAPVGKSRTMQVLREQIKRVARHDTPVLISGESGTGRETFARYLHSLSARAAGPFVALVAGSLTSGSAEQQLYGVAVDDTVEQGYLARAAGGTLFVNELEDLGDDAQRLLLAAIEQGGFVPTGTSETVTLDARLVSSVRSGYERRGKLIRPDLLAQLSVIPLEVPALRSYSEDVPDLLRYYVDKLVDTDGLPLRRFSVAAQNRLRNYPWPGNIQELKNMVQRLLIMGGDEEVGLSEVEALLSADAPASEPLVKQDLLALPLREAREQFERAYLQQQLVLCDGKVGQLAKRVGMERTHLYRKLRSLGVTFGQSGGDD